MVKLVETSNQDEVTIKICGAGGGGFFLGVTKEAEIQITSNDIWL
jgi:mevalonate kinase